MWRYRARGHGGFLAHPAQRSKNFKADLTPPSNISLQVNTLAESCILEISWDSTSVVSQDLSSGGHPDQQPIVIPQTNLIALQVSRGSRINPTRSS